MLAKAPIKCFGTYFHEKQLLVWKTGIMCDYKKRQLLIIVCKKIIEVGSRLSKIQMTTYKQHWNAQQMENKSFIHMPICSMTKDILEEF